MRTVFFLILFTPDTSPGMLHIQNQEIIWETNSGAIRELTIPKNSRRIKYLATDWEIKSETTFGIASLLHDGGAAYACYYTSMFAEHGIDTDQRKY